VSNYNFFVFLPLNFIFSREKYNLLAFVTVTECISEPLWRLVSLIVKSELSGLSNMFKNIFSFFDTVSMSGAVKRNLLNRSNLIF
jgi:hypothetical protein